MEHEAPYLTPIPNRIHISANRGIIDLDSPGVPMKHILVKKNGRIYVIPEGASISSSSMALSHASDMVIDLESKTLIKSRF